MARPRKNQSTAAKTAAALKDTKPVEEIVSPAEVKTEVPAEPKTEPAAEEKPAAAVAEPKPKRKYTRRAPVQKKEEVAAVPEKPKKRPGRKPKPVTVNDVVAKVYSRIDKKAAKTISANGKAAVDIKLYGSFEAHMYIEVKNGNVSVEPYDYIEKDLEVAVPVDVAVAIADGKLSVKEAVENGSLYVFGNVQFALKFAELFK